MDFCYRLGILVFTIYLLEPWTARLVIALGAETKLDLVPGAADFALPFSTLEDAHVSVSGKNILHHFIRVTIFVMDVEHFPFPFSFLYLDILVMQRVENKLRTLERRNFGKNSLIRIAVVGCGYSGVELAATISERLQDKGTVQAINVEKTICPQAPPGNREAALKVSHRV